MELLSMKDAPRDGTHILVYARWSWDNSYDNKEYQWRVAKYIDTNWWGELEPISLIALTSNPYEDYAVDPLYWVQLPEMETSNVE
jgi:hypothetical protein